MRSVLWAVGRHFGEHGATSCSLRIVLFAVSRLACVAAAEDSSLRAERGRYLVESILACGNCHTPKSSGGEPILERNLSGGGLGFSAPPFVGNASNITPDRETGVGAWTDAENQARAGRWRAPESRAPTKHTAGCGDGDPILQAFTLGGWTDAEIRRSITQGFGRDGRKLQPPMGFSYYYAKLTPADLDAIVAYLRKVPPVE